MNAQSNQFSTGARVGAVGALAISAIIVLVAVIGAVSGGGSSSSGPAGAAGGDQGGSSGGITKPQKARYTVKEGDTLTGISEQTGVPVTELERLNPGVDPQALIAGQELKLR